jgi:hypothetical protein
MTVESVIDRINRDWIQPPGEQPSRFVINDTGGISASDTTVVTETSQLQPEEEDLLAAGALLEVESELVLMTADPSGTSPDLTLTIRRAMYGTTAAVHADATEILIAGENYIPRFSILTAVADAVEGLWPDLWQVAVEETWGGTEPIELPSQVGEILDMRVNVGNRWARIGSWEELQDFPLSSTNTAIQVAGAGTSPIQVVYKSKTVRPTLEADTLVALNVDAGWVKVIVPLAVAGLVANRDLNQATIDFITQSLAAEAGGPLGSGTDIRNALLQFADFQMRPLKRQQALRQHDRVVIDQAY